MRDATGGHGAIRLDPNYIKTAATAGGNLLKDAMQIGNSTCEFNSIYHYNQFN
eukprot:COSAG04_NODE_34_length_34523_cov_40.302446_10_plen_53_part_00